MFYADSCADYPFFTTECYYWFSKVRRYSRHFRNSHLPPRNGCHWSSVCSSGDNRKQNVCMLISWFFNRPWTIFNFTQLLYYLEKWSENISGNKNKYDVKCLAMKKIYHNQFRARQQPSSMDLILFSWLLYLVGWGISTLIVGHKGSFNSANFMTNEKSKYFYDFISIVLIIFSECIPPWNKNIMKTYKMRKYKSGVGKSKYYVKQMREI